MRSKPARTAPYRQYRDTWMDHVPEGLYPKSIPSLRYFGTAGSCKRDEAGFFYEPNDWESDCVITLGLYRVEPKVKTALYRFRDAEDRLLYVGITDAPLRRWGQHAIDKSWWLDVANISLEWFESRAEALVAEAKAIRSGKPMHNVVHNEQSKSAA